MCAITVNTYLKIELFQTIEGFGKKGNSWAVKSTDKTKSREAYRERHAFRIVKRKCCCETSHITPQKSNVAGLRRETKVNKLAQASFFLSYFCLLPLTESTNDTEAGIGITHKRIDVFCDIVKGKNNDVTDELLGGSKRPIKWTMNTPRVSRYISMTHSAYKGYNVQLREITSRKRKPCIGRFYTQSENIVKHGGTRWPGAGMDRRGCPRSAALLGLHPLSSRATVVGTGRTFGGVFRTSGTVERAACVEEL